MLNNNVFLRDDTFFFSLKVQSLWDTQMVFCLKKKKSTIPIGISAENHSLWVFAVFHWASSGRLYYCFCPLCKYTHKIISTRFKAANLLHHQLRNPHLQALLTQNTWKPTPERGGLKENALSRTKKHLWLLHFPNGSSSQELTRTS